MAFYVHYNNMSEWSGRNQINAVLPLTQKLPTEKGQKYVNKICVAKYRKYTHIQDCDLFRIFVHFFR